ncbi:MAG: DUF4437 domain-containing protein [Pseudomonadota bacterium]
MARPQIEFVQCQALPWQDRPLADLRPGTQVRILSEDGETGACSLLVRYPPSWSRETDGFLNADEEFLVLDGDLTVGRHDYGYLGYGHLPAGLPRRKVASQAGAVVLTFFSAEPKLKEGTAECDRSRLVEGVDAFAVPYTGNFHPEFPPGAGRKMLFEDPDTGDQSWLLGTLGLRWAERAERHPVVEEMFLIAGEVHGNMGVMRPGAYFWRPPNIAHGPYGSLTGNIYFFRTKGGKLATEYEDPERPFAWWPDHRPVLPPELAGFAEEMPGAARPW